MSGPSGVGAKLQNDALAIQQKYQGLDCPGETMDHFVMQMGNYAEEIEENA